MMVDYIVIALIVVSFVFGVIRGVVSQVMAVAGIISAYVWAPDLGRKFGSLFQHELGCSRFVADKVAILLIGIAIYILARLLGFLLDRLLTKRVSEFKKLNRLGGGIFGVVKCTAILAAAFFFLSVIPTDYIRHWAPKLLESHTYKFAEKHNPMGRQAMIDRMRSFRGVVVNPEKVKKFQNDPEVEKLLLRHKLDHVLKDKQFLKTVEEGDYDQLRETDNVEKLMQDEDLTKLLDRLSKDPSG